MDINVSVGDVNLNDVIEGRGPWDEDAERYAPLTLADLVAEKLADRFIQQERSEWPGMRKRVSDVMNETVRERVIPIVDEAMSAPIRKTNSYGEPINGSETTMRELIISTVTSWLTGPAGSNGGSYGERKTNAQVLVQAAVGRELTKELSEAIATERAKIVKAVRDQAAAIIADAVSKGVGGK